MFHQFCVKKLGDDLQLQDGSIFFNCFLNYWAAIVDKGYKEQRSFGGVIHHRKKYSGERLTSKNTEHN